jgi:hypothetical protein
MEIHDDNVVNCEDRSRVCFTKEGIVKCSSRLSGSTEGSDEGAE